MGLSGAALDDHMDMVKLMFDQGTTNINEILKNGFINKDVKDFIRNYLESKRKKQ